MRYKWNPNATQKAAFKERMQDDNERQAYEERKRLKHSYAGFKDKFFVPTQFQYEYAVTLLGNGLANISHTVANACNMVMNGYSCNDKVHHSYIHIVNAIQRGEKLITDTNFE